VYTRAVHKETELENNIVEDGLKQGIIKLMSCYGPKLSVRGPDISSARRISHGGTTSCILTELYLQHLEKSNNYNPL
jgi:hypothetical protein